MNIFKRLLPFQKQKNDNGYDNNRFSLTNDDFFSNVNISPFNDTFLCNAWVNIAVNILIRNVARADFVLEREGVEVKNGPLFALFHRPNEHLSRYDLWKETAAWWLLEGEAFWWFGPDYGGGLPKQLYILNPQKLQLEGEGLDMQGGVTNKKRR
jgi:phage portal protein BeeE